MARRLPLAVRIGAGLILIAVCIFGARRVWVATRIWVPLDMPVSLAPGHIRSNEFEINLQSEYWIEIVVDRGPDYEADSCLLGSYGCRDDSSVVRASWTLSNSGRTVAAGVSDNHRATIGGPVTMTREIGGFRVEPGKHYVLDVDVLKDGSRLNAGHPRLKLAQMYYDVSYEEDETLVFVASMGLFSIGMVLLAIGIAQVLEERREERRVSLTAPGLHEVKLFFGSEELGSEEPVAETLPPARLPMSAWLGACLVLVGLTVSRFFIKPRHALSVTGSETAAGQNFQWAQRLPLRRPISGLPAFGLMAAMIFALFAMVMMWVEQPVIPMVLPVHLLKPGAVPAKSDAFTEPLIVLVKDAGLGQTPNLYVNSKQVAWQDLDLALKRELVVRREWIVYVGGDNGVDWQWVVNAMDAAKGRGAQVVLITGNAGKAPAH